MTGCKWCKRRSFKTLVKRDQTLIKGCYEEFRCRLICPKCKSRIPDFIIIGENLIEIYRYDLKRLIESIPPYPTIDGSNFLSSYNISVFGELLKSGWNINDEEFGGVELFYEACMVDDIVKVNELIDLGLDLEKFGSNALKFACSYASFKVYGKLTELGIKVTISHAYKIISHNNLDMLKRILDDGFDVNCKDNRNVTLIHKAAQFGSIELVKFLAENGADFSALDNDKWSVCHYACLNKKSLELVKYLFESGFNFNCRAGNGGTPLLLAIKFGCYKIAKYLIKSGVDVNAADFLGKTTLHCTNYFRYLKKREKLIKLLLDHNANVNALDNDRRTPLSYMFTILSKKLKRRFILQGADLEVQDATGNAIKDLLQKDLRKVLKKRNIYKDKKK